MKINFTSQLETPWKVIPQREHLVALKKKSHFNSDTWDLRPFWQQANPTQQINIIVFSVSVCYCSSFHQLTRESESKRKNKIMEKSVRASASLHNNWTWPNDPDGFPISGQFLSLCKLMFKWTEMSWNGLLPGRQEINLRTYARLGSNVKCRRFVP